MNTDSWIHLLEVAVVPILVIFIKKLTESNAGHSTALLKEVKEFKKENTDGLNNLADKIENTLIRHSDRLDNHNGRISTIEGRIDTPERHRRYND